MLKAKTGSYTTYCNVVVIPKTLMDDGEGEISVEQSFDY